MGTFEKNNKPYFTTVELITTLFFYNCQSHGVRTLVKHAESICTNDCVNRTFYHRSVRLL